MNPIMNLMMSMDWSMDVFLENSQEALTQWGGIIVGIVGIVMVIVGVVKLAVGLMQGGRGQVNWVMTIILIGLGGILAFTGGWQFVTNFSSGALSTIQQLGEDVIIQGLGVFYP